VHRDAANVLIHAKLPEDAYIAAGDAKILLLANPCPGTFIFPLPSLSGTRQKQVNSEFEMQFIYLLAFNFSRAVVNDEFNVGGLILSAFLLVKRSEWKLYS
jgi:hypothetical protein